MTVADATEEPEAGARRAPRQLLPATRDDRLALAALAAVVLVAALLRLTALSQQGFWFDEGVTGWLLRFSPGQILGAVPLTESNPPLYYMVGWLWARLFGNTVVGLRSLSAVAGILTVPVAYAAARELAGRRVALVAAALIAVNPFLIWYSQEARNYSLFVLIAALSFWLFVRARRLPTPQRLMAWGIVSALALTTHYFAAFMLLAEGLWLLADRRAPRRWLLGAFAIVGVTGLALLSIAYNQREHASWISAVRLRVRITQIPEQFLVGFSPPASLVPKLLAVVAVIVALALLARRSDLSERRGAAVAASVGLCTVLVPLLIALVGVDRLNGRNVILAVVPLVVALAAGLGARRAGIAGALATLLLVGVSIVSIFTMRDTAWAQKTNWEPVARALAVGHGPRAIVLRGSGAWARSLNYYEPTMWWDRREGRAVTQISVLRRLTSGRKCPNKSWWGAACDIETRSPAAKPPARGFRLVSKQIVAGFEVARYRSPRPVVIFPYQPIDDPTQVLRNPLKEGQRRHVLIMPHALPKLPRHR